MLPGKPVDRISSREPYGSLSEKWCCDTGASGRCQDIKEDIETFRSTVGLPADRKWQVPDVTYADDNTVLSTETLVFVQKLISENLQLRKSLEENQHLYTSFRAAEANIEMLSNHNAFLQSQLQEFGRRQRRSRRHVCWHYMNSTGSRVDFVVISL